MDGEIEKMLKDLLHEVSLIEKHVAGELYCLEQRIVEIRDRIDRIDKVRDADA